MGGIDKSGWLLTEDLLGEAAMEERIVHIHLVNRTVAGSSNHDHHVNGGSLDHRGEAGTSRE